MAGAEGDIVTTGPLSSRRHWRWRQPAGRADPDSIGV